MPFLDKLKGIFGKAKEKTDAVVDKNRQRLPDKVEKAYDKVSEAAEKIVPGPDSPDKPAGDAPPP